MKKIFVLGLALVLTLISAISSYADSGDYSTGVKEINLFEKENSSNNDNSLNNSGNDQNNSRENDPWNNSSEENSSSDVIIIDAQRYIPIEASAPSIQDEAELVSPDFFGAEPVRIISVYADSQNYYPGNFYINTNQLRMLSNVSPFILNQCLYGTGLFGLGYAFKCAEQKYGVNAFFLMGLAMHESNGGMSAIARDKNNLFGFMAYDRSPYQSAGYFRTREECIDVVAAYISKHYLTRGGAYCEGYSIESMNVHYASDPNWARGIKIRIMNLIAKIPVNQMRLG